MILGLILIAIGGLLLAKNRNLALMWANEYNGHHMAFTTSIVRQNIAIVGAILLAGGLALIVLF
ncbi:MAG TPA: hypothetical protein VEV84_08290 [Pyrinomonadaceae bacterium]|jgi:hypothetical protein|nr:hypothetical protein [Pyrinomonadaceae bacterium]